MKWMNLIIIFFMNTIENILYQNHPHLTTFAKDTKWTNEYIDFVFKSDVNLSIRQILDACADKSTVLKKCFGFDKTKII